MRALRERGSSQRSACRVIGLSERAMQYRHRRIDDPELIERLKALAAERLRWGWRRLLIMIRREGWPIGERAFRRIYRALGLHVMRTRKRHVRYVRGNAVEAVSSANERGSLDFMHARLVHGRTYPVTDDLGRREEDVHDQRLPLWRTAAQLTITLLDCRRSARGVPPLSISEGAAFRTRTFLMGHMTSMDRRPA